MAEPKTGTKPPTIFARPPKVLEEPALVKRRFHGHEINCWFGKVPLGSVKGWVSNARIELWVDQYKSSHAGREPTNDEIYEMMKADDEMKLKYLASRIAANGLQVPLVLEANGTLLDGNRRYFACRFLEEDGQGKEVRYVAAFVLLETAGPEEKNKILIEENFVPDSRLPWSEFVKSKRVFASLQDDFEDGTEMDDRVKMTAQLYGLKPSDVRRYQKMMAIGNEYMEYRRDEKKTPDWKVQQEANKWFQYFDEMSKTKVQEVLDEDDDLKARTFDLLAAEGFKNFVQIRKIPQIAEDSEARRLYFEKDPEAVTKAINCVNFSAPGIDSRSISRRIESIIEDLEKAKAVGLKDLDLALLDRLVALEKYLRKMVKAAKAE